VAHTGGGIVISKAEERDMARVAEGQPQARRAVGSTATTNGATPSTVTPNLVNVYALIAAVSGEIAKVGISKDRKNQSQGYAFRGIDDVFNLLAPMLAKHKLVVVPRVLRRECVERTTAKGGALFYVTVEAEFDFVSALDGSSHTARTFGEAMDSADKATNKAMSAAYKYAAFQTFCIPTEGDNDSENHTHEDILPESDKYEDWLVDMTAVAETDGYAALVKAIANSDEQYRTRLKSRGGKQWAAMKALAETHDARQAVPA
jgi:hypothetical protein